MTEYQEGRERWWYYPGRGRSQPSFLQAERTWERSCVLRVSAQPESLRFLVSGLSEVRNLVPSVFSFSNMAVAQTVLDTVRRASWGKNKKRLICISRYAIKIPGEIAWCGHYRSYSAFKRHNMRCSFEIFLRKGGRNRRLLLASRNCYFLCRRDNFRDRKNAVRINTSFLQVVKVLDLNVSFSLVLFSPQIFFQVHWHVHEGYWSSKIMCNLFWFSRKSLSARQMWNPPSLTCCCWGQQQVSRGFLFILVCMNSVLTKQRDYAHEELQRTISIKNKHTLYCFKNCGLLHLSTQTFPKNIIVNHLINGENRRKSKRLPAQRWKNQSAIGNDVIGQN